MLSCKQKSWRSLGVQSSTDYSLAIFIHQQARPTQGGSHAHGVWLRRGFPGTPSRAKQHRHFLDRHQAFSLLGNVRPCQCLCGGDTHSSGVPCLAAHSDNKNDFFLLPQGWLTGRLSNHYLHPTLSRNYVSTDRKTAVSWVSLRCMFPTQWPQPRIIKYIQWKSK